MALSASAITRMSGYAGVISNHTANPAKPAPAVAILSIAVAGTIFARIVPNRSTKDTRKYLTPFLFANAPRDAMNRALSAARVVCNRVNDLCLRLQIPFFPTRNPVGAGKRNPSHRCGFDGQCNEIFRLEIVDVRFAAGARDSLRLKG